MDIEIAPTFAGPPQMGHGGHVAGLFADGGPGACTVTLRAPTPLGVPLQLVQLDDGNRQLLHGEQLLAEAEPATLLLEPPRPPGVAEAIAAEAGSPSHYDGRGVHPTCYGCSILRSPGEGLRIAAGPLEVDGVAQVAATWTPLDSEAGPDGVVRPQVVVAALDCPGAFAFISNGRRAGLLGRLTFEQLAPVTTGEPHVVTGWRIDEDGRKLFAGTAIHGPDGHLRAAAHATWFTMNW